MAVAANSLHFGKLTNQQQEAFNSYLKTYFNLEKFRKDIQLGDELLACLLIRSAKIIHNA
jgi:hypothetical protein